jgi:hypothetical protein
MKTLRVIGRTKGEGNYFYSDAVVDVMKGLPLELELAFENGATQTITSKDLAHLATGQQLYLDLLDLAHVQDRKEIECFEAALAEEIARAAAEKAEAGL